MIQISGYTVHEKIGEGGSSEVFRATKDSGLQTVALKLLHAKYSNDPGMRKRLLREAEVLSALKDPNIIRIYGYGSLKDRIYMILEFLAEGSLKDYRKLSPRQRLKVMIQVCSGVEFIHERGIIHRDLKPSNIMFGSDQIPRLVDFGISLFSQENYTRLTHTNMVMGTLSYMSPEQQSDPGKVDHRSDIYSLGAILYEIFTGTKAVGRFENPSNLIDGFDKNLELCILKSMAHRPDERYPSVRLLSKGLLELWNKGLYAESDETGKANFDTRIGYWISRIGMGTTGDLMNARKRILENVLPEDVEQLVTIGQTSALNVRAAIIPALGLLKDRRASEFLIGQLSDPALAKEACLALGEIGDKRAVAPMVQIAKKNDVHSFGVLYPLVQLTGDKYIKLVLPYLKSEKLSDRSAALKAMELGATKKQLKDIKKYINTEKEMELRNRAYRLAQKLELS